MTAIVDSIRNSLAAKLLCTIAVTGFLLVLLISAIEISRERAQLIGDEQRGAQAAVSANIGSLSLAAWSFDQRALEVTARSLIQGTSIFRMEIVDDGETILRLARSNGPVAADYSWQIPLVRPNTAQPIGSLRLWESYDDVRNKMQNRAGMLVVTESIKILAISLILFYFIHRAITRPLSTLAQKVQSQGGDENSGWVTAGRPFHKGHDEIDALVEAINSSNAERKRLATEQQRTQAREAYAGKLEALGRLSGGIAHDFNNVLGAIMGFGRLLAQDVPAGSTQQRFAQRILASCDRGKELVEQIRAFARAEAPERRIVDLTRVIRQNEAFLSALLPKTTRLKFVHNGGELPVLSSETSLGQLIANLCVNASEAMEGHRGFVTVETTRATAEDLMSVRTQGSASGEIFVGDIAAVLAFACLRVSDSGGGIAHDVLDRIFDPFFTTKGRQRGTGLGLAVVYGVVESHGAACHVVSRFGEGTIFSIYLPLAAGHPADIAPATLPPLADLHGDERILIVDDEFDIMDALSIGFGRLGYEAVGINNPVEALAAFEEDPSAWDVVVTDQVMPEMRGLELIRRLKAIRPDIKTILCTGYSDATDEDLSQAAGVDVFLLKPLDAIGIAPYIRKLVGDR